MTELEEKIKYYADNYYRGNELISDAEYDALINQLKEQNPNSKLLNDIVGDDLKGISKKIKLPITMGTLTKFMTKEDFSKWYSSRHSAGVDLIVEVKCDGAGMCLVYEDGKFVQAISRGNGEYGEDTTQNILKVQGIPKEIPGFTGDIRGEVLLFDEVFEKYFKGESNPRNSAAGRLKQKDGKDCEKLNFVAYELNKIHGEVDIDSTELKKLEFLQKSGFQVPRWWAGAYLEDIFELRDNIEEIRKELGYGIDGLVIKYNKTDKEDLKRHIPTTQVAFKPECQAKATIVKDIIWQLAGTQFAPVAIVEPIELDGATVERASLSNINIMNDLGIYIGATVFIKRSGMVIPDVISVLNPKENAFEIPDICPVCGSKVEINSSGFPICPNSDCWQKIKHKFFRFFDVLGIKGTGEAFVNKMVDESGIKYFKDFLDLCIEENEIIDEWAGGINGRKIIKQIKDALKKPISTAKFLALFDYKGFDEKKLKQIPYSLDEMFNLKISDLIKLDGFGEIMANLFVNFMQDRHTDIYNTKNYFNIIDEEKKEGKLSNLSFCFTGAMAYKRSELEAMVVDNGGTVKGVSKGLSYLVQADPNSMSSKSEKAKSLGTKIITPEDFLNMIK